MDPPPPTTAAPTTAPPMDPPPSSPHSRATDSDSPPPPPSSAATKLRLMCSYGGHIVPRPHTKSLCYVGGDTRMIVLHRTTTLDDLLHRLSATLLHHNPPKPFTLKYQLPSEDLDSLITVSTDEDLDNMIDEYDRLNSLPTGNKPGRIRLFLFPVKPEGAQSMGNIILAGSGGSAGSDDWFLTALNGGGGGGGGMGVNSELRRGFSDPNSVDCLLGLDGNPNYGGIGNSDSNKGEIVGEKVGINNQDVQSVPESPMVETTSSFGSTASSPTMANLNLNLPQIRVHVEEGGARVSEQRVSGSEIEDQFAQMGLGLGGGGDGGGGIQSAKRVDEGFVGISPSPSGEMLAGFQGTVGGGGGGGGGSGGGGEFGNRVYVEDERFKQQHQQYQQQQQQQHQHQQQQHQQSGVGLISQQKPQFSGELPSPDSVSSDSRLSNAVNRQKPVIYQDPNGQLSSVSNRFTQVQQVSESGYALHPQQYDQYQQMMIQRHQQQQQQQQLLQQHHQPQTQPQPQVQSQPQTQQQPQAQQQYIPAGAQFVHHHPSGAMPMPAYYYPPLQPSNHPHQYPVYYVPAGQAQGQGYSLPTQPQPNVVEAPTSITSITSNSNRTQPPPNPTLITTPSYNPAQNINMQVPNSDMMGPGPVPGLGAPQQHQYVAYSQIHHPSSQPVGPNTGPAQGYTAYEFGDHARPQIYYTQPQTPVLASQYPGMTPSGPTMMMPDGSSQIPNEGVKQQQQQQSGSSQPL